MTMKPVFLDMFLIYGHGLDMKNKSKCWQENHREFAALPCADSSDHAYPVNTESSDLAG